MSGNPGSPDHRGAAAPPAPLQSGRLRRLWQYLVRALWPQTLTGRIVAILVAGMLAAQALTGTIWWDMRRGQLLEVPLRVVAARAADAFMLLASLPPEARGAAARTLASVDHGISLVDDGDAALLAAAQVPPDAVPDATARRMVADVLDRRAGAPVPLRLLSVELRGDGGQGTGTGALLTAREPEAHVHLLLGLGAGQWLQVRAREGESGYAVRPYSALADYVLRIYLLRIAVVVAVALVAVRIAMRPLARMARAADALGRDLQSPPLDTSGPREVRQAAQAFNAMQRRIADGVAERTRFLAAVSHDLRSPITRLRLRTEMLESDALRAKFRADLQEMESMVSATLDVLRGAGTPGPRHSVDIDALVGSLVQDLRESTGQAIPVHGMARAPLPGYAQSLRRCLQNLLENALRYAGSVQVQIEDTARELAITVRDGGPGIAPAHLPHVLEPFYRAEGSRNAASGGFGLGLSIADMVARAHGGRLELANRPEGGLDARLVLPRTASGAGNGPAPGVSLEAL
ncbi:ATP-binding protein [Paracidovorax avenae]|uniref:ATP-binding protein n=1 Tax=Paracidovorax avenae TaxID=80867 RepID=UPI001F1D4961|nr:ATP-binding protein [Paracidovorax avenae]